MEEGIGMLLWLALEIAVAGTGRVLVRGLLPLPGRTRTSLSS